MPADPLRKAHDDAHELCRRLSRVIDAMAKEEASNGAELSLLAALHGSEMLASCIRRICVRYGVPKMLVEAVREQASGCAKGVVSDLHVVLAPPKVEVTQEMKDGAEKLAKSAIDDIVAGMKHSRDSEGS